MRSLLSSAKMATTLSRLGALSPKSLSSSDMGSGMCTCEAIVDTSAYRLALFLTSLTTSAHSAVVVPALTVLDLATSEAVTSAALEVYLRLPSAYDAMFILSLINIWYYVKVRPLNPYSKEAAKLLIPTLYTTSAVSSIFFYHTAVKIVVSFLLRRLHAAGCTFGKNLYPHLQATGTSLRVPTFLNYLFMAITLVIALCTTIGLLVRHPTEGMPVDHARFAHKPKPMVFHEYGVGDHMPSRVILALRARGIDPEQWRKGPYYSTMTDDRWSWL